MDLPTPQQLAHFFSLSLDHFCVAGADGYFKHLNRAWQRTLGYTIEELLSRPYISFVHPEDYNATVQEQQSLDGGLQTLQFENRYIAKDGTLRWFSWNAVPQPDGNIYAVARDITTQKQDERDTRHLLQRLEQKNAELDEFAYIVSHDLKSPLRGIMNLSEWIKEDLGPTVKPEVTEQIEMLQARVARMQRLIEDLLKYAKMNTSDASMELVDLNTLIEEICSALLVPAGYKILVPQPLQPILARSSEAYQLFQNLLSNAVKYRSADTGSVVITQTSQADDWTFVVEDDGIGIDPKHHHRVFQVFQRLKDAEEIEGTGIGLALVKKIVEGMGGRITLASTLGHGSTFTFTWPKSPNGQNG